MNISNPRLVHEFLGRTANFLGFSDLHSNLWWYIKLIILLIWTTKKWQQHMMIFALSNWFTCTLVVGIPPRRDNQFIGLLVKGWHKKKHQGKVQHGTWRHHGFQVQFISIFQGAMFNFKAVWLTFCHLPSGRDPHLRQTKSMGLCCAT